ncbi:hypothetical protein NFI96_029788, partial [Prochilodus magdalenae]
MCQTRIGIKEQKTRALPFRETAQAAKHREIRCQFQTQPVQTLLQQMQDKFQTMSDQIIGRNILPVDD